MVHSVGLRIADAGGDLYVVTKADDQTAAASRRSPADIDQSVAEGSVTPTERYDACDARVEPGAIQAIFAILPILAVSASRSWQTLRAWCAALAAMLEQALEDLLQSLGAGENAPS